MKQRLTIKANTTFKYMKLWNGVFDLTHTELRVLASMVDNSERLNGGESISTPAVKKAVAADMNREDFNTLNNYVKKIKDKGAIFKQGNRYVLHRLLNPKTKHIEVNILE